MRDFLGIWRRALGRSYSAVNTNSNYNEQKNEGFAGQNNNRKYGRNIRRQDIKGYFIIAILGLLFVLSGLFILAVNPYDKLFKWKIVFGEGGEIFEIWRKPPVDLYLRVFLFNITNKDAFLRGDEKLKVEEVGPYVYRELMSHDNVTFNDNGTVSAIPKHPLIWVPEMSAGDHETDQLILPNIALLSIADVVSESSYFTRLGLNLLIRQTNTHPLVQMSPQEFMFGYASTLMSLGNRFLPGWVSFDKLGLIDRMYDFAGDFETIYTGEDDVTKSGLLDTYNGSPQMVQWEGQCGNIRNASDGTKFRSHVGRNDTLKFFRKSMCRPQFLIPINETESAGLAGYVYKFPPNAMDNGIVNKENTCFCKTEKCLPNGLLDVRQCYYGFPIALSYPHFLDADPSLPAQVEGYESDRRKHESYFVIQPQSGLPLDVAVRFQINMALGKIGTIAHVSRFEDLVLPLLWTEIRLYNLPQDLSTRFKMYLNVLPMVTQSGMVILFILGAILLVISSYTYAKRDVVRQPVSWLDEEVETESMNKKLTNYRPGKKNSMSSKELEVYFNSLVTPLNQDIDVEYHELSYQEFKDKE